MSLSLFDVMEDLNKDLNMKKADIMLRFTGALDAEQSVRSLENRITNKREEIKARHEREWVEFEVNITIMGFESHSIVISTTTNVYVESM